MKILDKYDPEVHTEFLDGNFVAKMTKTRFNQVSVHLATELINMKDAQWYYWKN